MSAAPIAFRDVTVRYDGRTAVDGVSLDVAPGSLTVILGQSGSGKSTLLRTVNRLVLPDAGSVLVDGRDVRDAVPTELRRGIGYVIQAVGLFPHMTVAKNIAVVPELLGWERERIAARVDELLTLVRLHPGMYRDRLPRALSGGEAQRVGVARALAAQPGVLLMDEPFGAVDPLVRRELQDETLRIARTIGATFLFVTHDVEEALRLADRIVVMHQGRILQADTPLETLARPADPYVADLLDTHDTIRKLSFVHARDTVRPGAGANGAPSVAADAPAREVLDRLLDGAAEVNVLDGERVIGTADFDGVRRAIAPL